MQAVRSAEFGSANGTTHHRMIEKIWCGMQKEWIFLYICSLYCKTSSVMRQVNVCFKQVVTTEPHCYWYHPDHLGSSSWITYSDGSAVQHLHYLPWGEDFVDQRSGGWNSMYTFSAKEKDTETGYSYFGSRYYSSDLSIWLSVDPMADKYSSLSPYTYCANNPVKLVDPKGEEIDPESMPLWNKMKSLIDFEKKLASVCMNIEKKQEVCYLQEQQKSFIVWIIPRHQWK
jgi:RHS repeat-associated protein